MMRLDGRFLKQARGRVEKYSFDVGVLQDKPHKNPKRELKSFAGGKARSIGRGSSATISQVSESLRKKLKLNFYTKPFRSKHNRDLLVFMRKFFQVISGRTEAKRLENSLQAIIRNPILRKDYGDNTDLTAKIKGFNHLMIDTGQLFRAIKAKVRLRNV